MCACGGPAASDALDETTAAPSAATPSAQTTAVNGLPGVGSAAGSGAIPVATPSGPATGAAATGTTPATTDAAATAPAVAADATATATAAEPVMPREGVIPENCRGFSIEGIKYSPGGDVLPNTCEPYHPTTNNPYAVRCTDVWPWFKTQFPGDNYCILPPPPDQGIQYGVHPQGKAWYDQISQGDLSGYEGLSDEWIMEPGEEEDANYETSADTTEEKFYYRNQNRMRPGSHHMIVTAGGGSGGETWGPGAPGFFSGKNVPGAQRPDENNPKTIAKPPEDEGLFMRLPSNPGITFNMHHFNATSETILKEAWTNLWWEPDTRQEVLDILGLDFGQVASLAVTPGDTVDLHYSWDIAREFRILSIFGHRHAWTSAFTSWVEKSDGELDLVYASLDWYDEPTYRYDSLTMNPEPIFDQKVDGAHSGIMMVPAGSKLHFNCHITYTDERAEAEGAPKPAEIGTLRFANQAFTAEMCLLFGQTLDNMLIAPTADSSALPDFATTE